MGVPSGWRAVLAGWDFSFDHQQQPCYSALVQLKTSVDASKTGEVVVSQECWDLVSSRCTGEPRGSDWLVTEVYDSVVTKVCAIVEGTRFLRNVGCV